MKGIAQQPRNARAVQALISAMRHEGITPFIGAGLSVPFHFPGWLVFLKHCARSAHVDLTPYLDQDLYEEAAEALVAAKGRAWLDKRIRRTFGRDVVRFPEAAATLLHTLTNGPVVTTNFDHVLEKVFREAKAPFLYEVWGGRPVHSRRILNENLHVLIKIHGDARIREGRVLTRREYDLQYGPQESAAERTELTRMLLGLFRARPLLFLGCRVEHDRYLRLLKEAGSPPGGWHFAVLPREGSPARLRARAAYLRRLHIRPLWYEAGRYTAIREFIAELADRNGGSIATHEPEPAVDRIRLAVKELERELSILSKADERIDRFLDSEDLFWQGGLASDYWRLAEPILKLAQKHHRYCDALRIASHMGSMVLNDERKLGQTLRWSANLARHCRDKSFLVDYEYNQAIAYERRDPAKAKRIYARLERTRWPKLATAALRRRGMLEAQTGSPRRARELLELSAQRAATFPDHQARSYTLLGMVCEDLGDYPKAIDAYRAAVRLYRKIGDADGISGSLNNLANIEMHYHRWSSAYRLFQRALKYAQIAGGAIDVSIIRGNQAELLYRQAMRRRKKGASLDTIHNEIEEVHEHLTDILIRSRSGAARGHILTQRALVTALLRDTQSAIEDLVAAARILRRHGDARWLWTNYYNRGLILSEDGQNERVATALRKALQLARQLGLTDEEQRTMSLLAQCQKNSER